MSDLRDEEDIYQEELDYYFDDEECERHDEYDEVELEEIAFWEKEKVIYDNIDYDEFEE